MDLRCFPYSPAALSTSKFRKHFRILNLLAELGIRVGTLKEANLLTAVFCSPSICQEFIRRQKPRSHLVPWLTWECDVHIAPIFQRKRLRF